LADSIYHQYRISDFAYRRLRFYPNILPHSSDRAAILDFLPSSRNSFTASCLLCAKQGHHLSSDSPKFSDWRTFWTNFTRGKNPSWERHLSILQYPRKGGAAAQPMAQILLCLFLLFRHDSIVLYLQHRGLSPRVRTPLPFPPIFLLHYHETMSLQHCSSFSTQYLTLQC